MTLFHYEIEENQSYPGYIAKVDSILWIYTASSSFMKQRAKGQCYAFHVSNLGEFYDFYVISFHVIYLQRVGVLIIFM